MAEVEVRRSSRLAAPAERVWAFAVSEAGLAHEFGPWMRMTIPAGLRGKTIEEVVAGQKLGRSWILLAGFIPIDYDDLLIAEIGPGMRFVETSRLGSARSWRHEREVVALGEGSCGLRDTLTFQPRAPIERLGLGGVAKRVVGKIFNHLHSRLVERWGSP